MSLMAALFGVAAIVAPAISTAGNGQGVVQTESNRVDKALEGVESADVGTAPDGQTAPQVDDPAAGWSFGLTGRLMYDFATVDAPRGVSHAGLGFSNDVRRARLGVNGTVPGGFGYKLEVDVATGDVEFADAYLSHKGNDLEVIAGQHNNFQSLDELTSSLHSSFIERAAFTDAFAFQRRVGVSVQYAKGAILAQAGIFTGSIRDLTTSGGNDSLGLDGRIVFAPKTGSDQLHFGASVHYRDFSNADASVRFSQRPAVQTTEVRFVDTGSISAVRSEAGFGLEAVGIFGRFHVASEGYWQHVSRAGSDPTFFGAYVEGGYFFTGEVRGYKNGKFDRVKVKRPFGGGGLGSLGANVRWDYLDLNDKGVVGGTQNAFQASLNWKPTDNLLLGLNYAHILYAEAAIPANGDRDYSVNVAAVRAQIDF